MPKRPRKKTKNMSEETQDTPNIDINLGDFNAVIRIIDVASKRGAFEGTELSSVGAVRDKLSAFVEHHTPKPEDEKATTEGAEVTEETSE
jgi:hypothetical protein